MKIIENENQINTTLVIDDKAFINCSFTNCVLVYSGNHDCQWVNCQLVDCRIQLVGAALRTSDFLVAAGWNPPLQKTLGLQDSQKTLVH